MANGEEVMQEQIGEHMRQLKGLERSNREHYTAIGELKTGQQVIETKLDNINVSVDKLTNVVESTTSQQAKSKDAIMWKVIGFLAALLLALLSAYVFVK